MGVLIDFKPDQVGMELFGYGIALLSSGNSDETLIKTSVLL